MVATKYEAKAFKHKAKTLVYTAVLCLFYFNTFGDEFGVATGVNSSFYNSFITKSTEYQKTNYFSPVEIYFRKDITRFFGIHSALQYTKRSNSTTVQAVNVGSDGSLLIGDYVKYERTLNYLSIEVSPLLSHSIGPFSIDARVGLSGDIYINEWENFFGEASTSRSKITKPFVLALATGAGIGYMINDRFKLGIKSNISRNFTDIFKNQNENSKLIFLNWYNVVYAGMTY